MSDPIKDAFIQEAVQDLLAGERLTGAPGDEPVKDTPAPAQNSFQQQPAPRVNVSLPEDKQEELRNAFARSIIGGEPVRESEDLADKFKESAGAEAQEMLSKMLKGLR